MGNNAFTTLLAFMLLVSGLSATVGGASTIENQGYDNMVDNLIWIYDVYDLQAMKDNPRAHYALANDINATITKDIGFEPVGIDWENRFTGILDGNNHTIINLHINHSHGLSIGLFGYTGLEAEVKNIGLVNNNITGKRYVGGLVGRNSGIVSNSYATGSTSGDTNVGGLVGYNQFNGMVSYSYATGEVSGSEFVGGLVGWNRLCTIENSYATGTVNGGYGGTGGLVGYNTGIISNNYANADVRGINLVGGLVGTNSGSVEDSRNSGEVKGIENVGGLVGRNFDGDVVNSSTKGDVTGDYNVGGLVGYNWDGRVSSSNAGNNVSGKSHVGGLIGYLFRFNHGFMSESYFTGSVDGTSNVGGLVGFNLGSNTIFNSHYNIDSVVINGGHHVTRGGMFDAQYQDWFFSGMKLNISDYNDSLVPNDGYFEISDVQGIRDTLGFTGLLEYRFRLSADIDMSNAHGLCIPYLAGFLNGNGHVITDLTIDRNFSTHTGFVEYAERTSSVSNISLVDVYITGNSNVGALVGYNRGNVLNSSITGNVSGTNNYIGGLIGYNRGIVSDTSAEGDILGDRWVGGLVGHNDRGMVSESFSKGSVIGNRYVGGLVGYNQNDEVFGSRSLSNVEGYNYVGGLVGYNEGGTVSKSYAEGDVIGVNYIGGFVGYNEWSTVSNSYSTGIVTGHDNYVGGFIGHNIQGTISNSYSTGDVYGNRCVGGFVGWNRDGTLSNSYAMGDVSGEDNVGGFVGHNDWKSTIRYSYSTGKVTGVTRVGGLVGSNSGEVLNCFWDVQSSEQTTSDGGTGKRTSAMMKQGTFTNAGWDFTHRWWMVEGISYPLLWWQEEPDYEEGSRDLAKWLITISVTVVALLLGLSIKKKASKNKGLGNTEKHRENDYYFPEKTREPK